MTTPKPITPQDTGRAHIEDVASEAAVVAGGAFRVLEVGPIVLIGLLICPPLAILTFVVVAPLLVIGLVLGLFAAVLTAPYLLVHHFRSHDRRHASLLAHRLRGAGGALVDLLPHRIVADARNLDRGGG
jgi:hypothetical protein